MRGLIATLRAARDNYRRDRVVLDRILRTIQLLERPIAAYERRFEAFDQPSGATGYDQSLLGLGR